MSKRPLLLGGLLVAGAGGYYLYNAGGDPKVAEKQFQRKILLTTYATVCLTFS